jgi:hypothetical protein
MALRVSMTIALRDEHGVVFGNLDKVSDRHLQVSIDADYQRGQVIEFQFALEGMRRSVQGEAAVIRVVPDEKGGGLCTYALKIVSLSSDAKRAFEAWLYELAQGGGTSAKPHRDHASSIISTISRTSERRREGERRLARLERSQPAQNPSWVSSIAASQRSESRTGVGRAAVRAALRGFADRSTDGSHSASVTSRAKPDRLQVKVRPATFLHQYRDHLDHDVLFLRLEAAELPVDSAVRVHLVLPTDDRMRCDAVVGAHLPSGTGLILHLEDQERSTLRAVATQLMRQRRARSARGVTP